MNPLDTAILKQAQAFLPLLEEAYEVAPENELLKDYLPAMQMKKKLTGNCHGFSATLTLRSLLCCLTLNE